MKKVVILGITGSIGQTALRGISRCSDLAIVGATYHNRPFNAPYPTLKTNGERKQIEDFIRAAQPDIVLNGISGSRGLEASIAAIDSGCPVLALANKETIVLGGKLFLDYASSKKVTVIPVDSEHSAIDELLITNKVENTDKLIITASGGPFLNTDSAELEKVSPEQAVKHPTWNMGPKISIDSATLANKGLEVIEASFLFGFKPSDIEVVIHPQSIVHSMIRTKSGQIYAQMSPPDMVFPIMRALLERNVTYSVGQVLDFISLDLNFRKLDSERFPFVDCAFRCAESRGFAPSVFNIADEVAVQAFISGKIKFTEIYKVVEKALNLDWGVFPSSVLDIPSIVPEIQQKVAVKCL